MPQSNYQAFHQIASHPQHCHIAHAWHYMITTALARDDVRTLLLNDDIWPALYQASVTVTSIPQLRRAIICCAKRYKLVLRLEHLRHTKVLPPLQEYEDLVSRMNSIMV